MSLEVQNNFEGDLIQLIDMYNLVLSKEDVKKVLTNQLWRLEGKAVSSKEWYALDEDPVILEEEEEENYKMLFERDFKMIRTELDKYNWYKDKEVDGSFDSILKRVCKAELETATPQEIARCIMLVRVKNPTPKKEGQLRYTADKSLNKGQRNALFRLFDFHPWLEKLDELEKLVIEEHGKQNKETLKAVQVDTVEVYGGEWMEKLENAHLPPTEETVEDIKEEKTLSAFEKFMNL